MDSLFYALVILGIIVLLIALYGFIQGGTSGMLEKEMNHNTIDADLRIETTRYIDFFKQVKRVDSIYVHQATKTLQIKKNNRLSKPFLYKGILKFNVEFNGQTILQNQHAPFFIMPEENLPEDVDAVDWGIAFELEKDEHIILFDSYDALVRVMDELSQIEKNVS